MNVGLRAVQHSGERAVRERRQHVRLTKKKFLISNLQRFGDAFSDRRVRSYYEHASFRDAKGKRRNETGLSTTDGNLDNSRRLLVLEMLANQAVGFALWLAQAVVGFDIGNRAPEEPARVELFCAFIVEA